MDGSAEAVPTDYSLQDRTVSYGQEVSLSTGEVEEKSDCEEANADSDEIGDAAPGEPFVNRVFKTFTNNLSYY